MQFERAVLQDVEDSYKKIHERWRVSHGDVITFERNSRVAFTPLSKPMREATVALVSTGGVHLTDQRPYDMASRVGDMSLRFIPAEAQPRDLLFTHDHYDHTSADVDPNCMFPLEHLRSVAREGLIGSVAATHIGASGWIPRPGPFLKDAVPQIVDRFRADGVDVALLTGG